MKMICPHCGVSGSADDSLLGRKVKCPKCTGIFEVVADIAQPISMEETDIEELLENDILSGIDENSMGGGPETGDELDDSEPEDLFGEESLADNDEDIVEESLFEGGSIEDEELALQDTLSGESGLESVDADTEIGTLEESDADLGDILDESELDELLSQEGEAETEEIGAETDEDLPIIEDDSELEDFEVEGEDVPVEGEESVEEQMEVEVETFDVNAEDGISDVELAEDPDIDNLSPEVDEESVEEEVAEDDGLSDDVDLDAEDVDSIEVQESGADEVALKEQTEEIGEEEVDTEENEENETVEEFPENEEETQDEEVQEDQMETGQESESSEEKAEDAVKKESFSIGSLFKKMFS